MAKFDTVSIDSEEEAMEYRDEWIDKFGEKKSVYTREEVVEQNKDPSEYDIDGCEIVNDEDNLFKSLFAGVSETNNLDLKQINHFVKVDSDTCEQIKNNTQIPEMADDAMRNDYERYTGEIAERAMIKLAQHLDLDVKVLPDDNHIHAGDFLVEGYIAEFKSVNITHSRGANIVLRHHQQDNTAEMHIKNGIFPEMFIHSYVYEMGGEGMIIGIVGWTHTHPRTDGLLSTEPFIIESQPYFALQNPHYEDWYDLDQMSYINNIEKLQKFNY